MVSCHTAGICTGEQAELVRLMMYGPHPCRETLVLKSPAAPCMGEDVHGNKYFEDSAQPAGPLLSSVCAHCCCSHSCTSPASTATHRCRCYLVALTLLPWFVRAGQHRWVLYADKHKQTGLDPTTVPPEWHGAPPLLPWPHCSVCNPEAWHLHCCCAGDPAVVAGILALQCNMLLRSGAAGWLHFMTDSKPGDKPASYPIYSVEPHGRPNPTGSFKRYQPKVHTTGRTIVHQSIQCSLLAVMIFSLPLRFAQTSGPSYACSWQGCWLHCLQQAATSWLPLHILHICWPICTW
jgi:NADH:ubiquinone oxidoreductase subunit